MMDTHEERLKRFGQALAAGKDICCSEGSLSDFPAVLKKKFTSGYLGLVICRKGHFRFTLNGKPFAAGEGETVFLSEAAEFCVTDVGEDLQADMLFYRIGPIRELLGSSVVAMYLYLVLTPEPCLVWPTGEEEDLSRYMGLLRRHGRASSAGNPFDGSERTLLLLALTYRLCSLYSRRLLAGHRASGHKTDTFIRLIRLVGQFYKQERGVAFYAEKLCLSPKYLSVLCKSVCGYTVQELVFRAIVRRSMFLLKNTRLTVQQIADELHFPNASAFGTFFRKETGMSPLHFRDFEDVLP